MRTEETDKALEMGKRNIVFICMFIPFNKLIGEFYVYLKPYLKLAWNGNWLFSILLWHIKVKRLLERERKKTKNKQDLILSMGIDVLLHCTIIIILLDLLWFGTLFCFILIHVYSFCTMVHFLIFCTNLALQMYSLLLARNVH